MKNESIDKEAVWNLRNYNYSKSERKAYRQGYVDRFNRNERDLKKQIIEDKKFNYCLSNTDGFGICKEQCKYCKEYETNK